MLAERLGHFVRLTSGEQASLRRLEEQRRTHRRGTTVVRQGEPAHDLFVVREGWLHGSVLLGSGSRQILRFHFPGDLVGSSAVAFRESPETLTAVTDVTLSLFGRDRVGALFAEHPRIGALLFALALSDRVSLADRLASFGRASARARVSALLCELYQRLRAVGLFGEAGTQLPLTQEDIGDATGLTSVHVNRMMRALAEDGLIERSGNHLRIIDEAGLCADANLVDRGKVETDWLPPPR